MPTQPGKQLSKRQKSLKKKNRTIYHNHFSHDRITASTVSIKGQGYNWRKLESVAQKLGVLTAIAQCGKIF